MIKAIWAAARGEKNIAIDDSNVPPPVKVISNVGGGSRSSSALKRKEALITLSPEESLAKIKVPEGYELNLSSPRKFNSLTLANPVQMQVDA